MQRVKALFHTFRSSIHKVTQTLSKGPLSWGVILLTVVLYYLFFFSKATPGMTMEQLMPFGGCSLLPIIIGAWRKGWRGALFAWFLLVPATILNGIFAYGATWISPVNRVPLLTLIIATLGVGLAAGQFRSTSYRLGIAYHKLAEAHAIIQKQALTDALTGLPNHRAIMDQLEKELDRARIYGRSFSLLFFDADRFKHVNDTYGHGVGDAVLCQIGKRAGSILRGGDTLGRFGGEEFVVLLPEADAHEAADVAERIRATIAAGSVVLSEEEGSIAVTVSIGLATHPSDGTSEKELLSQADEAMYIAKHLGRNQVRTAEDARHMSTDIEMMALLQHEGQHEAAEREDITPERLRETYTLRTIGSLMILLERRNEGLSAHAHAVSDLATTMATAMRVDPKDVNRIGMAALLHDIGKVAVPDVLLRKSTPLSSQEQQLLHDHAELGAQILEVSPFLYDLMPMVRHHHERWDGGGYPEQLKGAAIPLAARIIAVAEAYDSMQTALPYQASRSPEEAVTELQRCAGTQFDPAIVAICSTLLTDQQQAHSSLQRIG
jgi:two-component system, cell cycle response regulator